MEMVLKLWMCINWSNEVLEPYREEEDTTGVYMEDCGGWWLSSGYSSVARPLATRSQRPWVQLSKTTSSSHTMKQDV